MRASSARIVLEGHGGGCPSHTSSKCAACGARKPGANLQAASVDRFVCYQFAKARKLLFDIQMIYKPYQYDTFIASFWCIERSSCTRSMQGKPVCLSRACEGSLPGRACSPERGCVWCSLWDRGVRDDPQLVSGTSHGRFGVTGATRLEHGRLADAPKSKCLPISKRHIYDIHMIYKNYRNGGFRRSI